MEFTGRTVPYEAVELRARVSGFLEKVVFEEGSEVKAGDLLYEIERAPYEAALEAAKAELARAEAKVVETQFDLEKVKNLSEKGVTSQQELVIAQANYDSAVATKLAAESKVTQAELDLGYTRITAPIAGVINESRVDPGNLVGQRAGKDHTARRLGKPQDIFLNRTACGMQFFLGEFFDGDGCWTFEVRAASKTAGVNF